MNVPNVAWPIRTLLHSTCSTPTDKRFLILLRGTLLATGRRTMTTILRTVRQQAPGHRASSHRGLSQRRWSTWGMARALIRFWLAHGVPPGPVLLAGDETVTEHLGPKVVGQGRQGEGVRASAVPCGNRGVFTHRLILGSAQHSRRLSRTRSCLPLPPRPQERARA
jgi:hypothetical protein